MANQQQKKQHRSAGSQNDHLALPARQRNPESVLIRMIRSNGSDAALAYAKKYDLMRVFNGPAVTHAVWRSFDRREDRRIGLRLPTGVPTE